MRILVSGSAGHLGEALMRTLEGSAHEVTGVDVVPSPFTHRVGSITERGFVKRSMQGVAAVLHTATLHKPHVETHTHQDFIDTNVTGTLNLLEEATAAGVRSFVFTSTTSAFGRALIPPPGAPAAWITENVTPVTKNIYGVSKLAAESLCELHQREKGLPCIVLRTSRFFPDDLPELRTDAPSVARRLVPAYADEYARRGWSMVPTIDRVYVNAAARAALGWRPRYDFAYAIQRLRAGEDFRSPLARAVGSKGYHGRGATPAS